jgi:peptide/nickel transport system substrate-binding protein
MLLPRLPAQLIALLIAACAVLLPGRAEAQRDIVRVVGPWEIGGLDPNRSGYNFSRMQVTETLVTTDAENRLVPALAESWQVSPDQLSWSFRLRPGVVFHDGTSLTADAVVASLQRARVAPGILASAPIAAMEPQDGAVLIRTTRPFAALPAFLANYTAQVLAPASGTPDGTIRAIIGTGPFRVTSITAPQGFEVERTGTWWGGRVAIAAARYTAVGRGETRALMAETGEADMVFNLPPSAFDRLRRSPRVALIATAIPRTYTLKLNAGGPFFAERGVRQALSAAIDRQGIATAILRDPEVAATQLFPPTLAGWHTPDLPPLAYDQAAARRMLAAAGWQPGADGVLQRGGRRFAVTLRTFPDRPEQPVMATAIQAQLRDVGIAVEVAIGNSSDIPAGHRDGTLDLALAARNFSLVPDPLGTLLQDYGAEGGDWGAMGWSSPELVAVMERLGATFDAAAAAPLRRQAAAILQAELPVLPLAWFTHSVAASRRLTDVSLDPYELSYRLSAIARSQ